jgi:hypothetical protein
MRSALSASGKTTDRDRAATSRMLASGNNWVAKARENFEKFGAVEERLAQHTRRPYLWER